MNLREWLKKARIKKDLRQEDVAKLAGITQASYSLLEKGARTPRPAVAKRIAAALDIDWTDFFAEKKQN